MKGTKAEMAAAARKVVKRAERILGGRTARQLAEAADEALVQVGHAAEDRQRRRATKRALVKAAKVTAVVGAGAAAVLMAGKALRK